jgi:hypothetical protein
VNQDLFHCTQPKTWKFYLLKHGKDEKQIYPRVNNARNLLAF